MSATKGENERPLKELLSKISHPLSDVRSRSLRSVAFKLNNGLVTVDELATERQLLISLLEWFNYEEWTCESQVLGLLLQLTQHTTAAQTVVEVGGVEFLSQLRLHCDPALHSLIDDILEQLLKLPAAINQNSATTSDSNSLFSSLTSFEHPEAVYPPSKPTPTSEGGNDSTSSSSNTPLSHSNTGATSVPQPGGDPPGYSSLSTSDVGSYMEISRESFGIGTAVHRGATGLPGQCLRGSNGGSEPYSVSERSTQLSSLASASLEGGGSCLGGPMRMPYTESMVIPRGEEGSCVARQQGTFPWLWLTDNDRNILITTQSRLQGCADDSLIRSCEFIQDVLFQDFPAEVFLQRPALLKGLLQLLDQRDSSSCQLPSILSCLSAYTHTLHKRMEMVGDPGMALADSTGVSELAHSNASNSSAQSNDLETLTPEMLSQLQSEQLSVTQFTLLLISAVSALVPCLLTRDSAEIGEEGRSRALSASPAHSLSLCVETLSAVVCVCEGMKDEGHSGKLEIEGAVDALCSALSQCLSKWRRLSGQERGGSCGPQLQMVSMVTIQLTHTLCQVLEQYKTSGVVPLPTVMSGLMMNGVLGLVCPSLLDRLLPVFERVDAPSCRLFHQVRAMSESFHQISQFLDHPPSTDESHTLPSAISMATGGLNGLWFTANQAFIKKAMELAFSVLTSYDPDSSLWVSAKSLVLRLVGHGSADVKGRAYKHLRVSLCT